jgi:hypothetical protein
MRYTEIKEIVLASNPDAGKVNWCHLLALAEAGIQIAESAGLVLPPQVLAAIAALELLCPTKSGE